MKKILMLGLLLISSYLMNAQVVTGPGGTILPENPCSPCAGNPWNGPYTLTDTFTLAVPCTFKLFVTYYTRTCLGKTEIYITSSVFTHAPGTSPLCNLKCVNAPALKRVSYYKIMGVLGTNVVKLERASCHYVGSITIPPGAEVCFGMTPGSNTAYTLLPCDTTGCCYTELTRIASKPYTYNQNVIYSSPCPTSPYIPSNTMVEWACDILGGGFVKFMVPFTPDTPLTCVATCYPGWARQIPQTEPVVIGATEISNLTFAPNPMSNELNISFSALHNDEKVEIVLMDLTGRVLLKENRSTVEGLQNVRLQTSGLPAGNYICRFTHGQMSLVSKLVK